jgi:hypothetical protein
MVFLFAATCLMVAFFAYAAVNTPGLLSAGLLSAYSVAATVLAYRVFWLSDDWYRAREHVPQTWIARRPYTATLLLLTALALGAASVARLREVYMVTHRGLQAAHELTLIRQLGNLHSNYLEGDLHQARRSLEESLQVCEQLPWPPGRAEGLFLTYCRLYTLDKRAGDGQEEPDLIKARYWGLRMHEISPEPIDKASYVTNLTGDNFIKRVDKQDRDKTDGRGPRYLQLLEAKQPNP